jgi:hypothetical protein
MIVQEDASFVHVQSKTDNQAAQVQRKRMEERAPVLQPCVDKRAPDADRHTI